MPWDSDSLLQQLELGEDSRVEFKEAVFAGNRVREPRRDSIADELAAFGNTLGGTLIFSVTRRRQGAVDEPARDGRPGGLCR